jgi:hypothetical protein
MSAARAPQNLPASIRQRLLDRARVHSEDFQLLLDRYAVERLLYRLSVSDMRDEFLLKGALLFALWFSTPHRPTRDADLLGLGPANAASLAQALRRISSIQGKDGIAYDSASIKVQEIRENTSYPGLRATLRATLDGARCNVQLDVGYGDAVAPPSGKMTYPILLDGLPAPELNVYPRESVFSETLEALVVLGMANTRMKNYFDLLALAREGKMDSSVLARAINATFSRRKTKIPEAMPVGLSAEFARDAQKQGQWRAFLDRNRLEAPDLETVISELADYLHVPLAKSTA